MAVLVAFTVAGCGRTPLSIDMDAWAEPPDSGTLALDSSQRDARREPRCPGRLLLRPVTLVGWSGTGSCPEPPHAVEIHATVWRREGPLVRDRLYPCDDDAIDIGEIAPGDYDVALSLHERFFAGLELIHAHWCAEGLLSSVVCTPIEARVEECSTTIVPVSLFCVDYYGGDHC